MKTKQLTKRATEVLIEKLGITEATRFLALQQKDRLDSVEWHRK